MKKTSLQHQNKLADEGGFITLDFIFAAVLVAGMFTACFAICLTLTAVEVAQYISFSTARVFFAGHSNETDQQNLAIAKFSQLAGTPPFTQLFFRESSYFSLSLDPQRRWNYNDEFPADLAQDNGTFLGARLVFRAKILEFNIPLWGAVTPPDGNGFSANISTYLSREPVDTQISDFNDSRWEFIRKLDSAYSQHGGTYVQGMRDNG